ncbi:NDUB2 dehydrogenase, partial [Pterocles burchelli]|nr:NDUB2 dehydrogenase [Pterocles burchelli]
MLASLGRSAGRLLRVGSGATGLRRAGGGVHIQPRYRQFPELTRAQVIRSELLSGFMWFWILWHFWHSSDMVLVRPARRRTGGDRGLGRAVTVPLPQGHFPYPDASAWTDEELGIPPDDAE